MGLSISKSKERAALMGPPLRADRRLYLAEDGKTVVEANSARAATLLAAEGGEITRQQALDFGLGYENGKVVIGGSLLPAHFRDGTIVADRRIALNFDKTKIVDPTDPAAAYIFANVGDVIDADAVKRLGLELVDGKVVQQTEKTKDAPTSQSGAKEAERSEDKNAGPPSEDKSRTATDDKAKDKPAAPKRGTALTPKEAKKKGQTR